MPLYRDIHISDNDINLQGIGIYQNGIKITKMTINNNGILFEGLHKDKQIYDLGYTQDSLNQL
jgi:hypothetical protein